MREYLDKVIKADQCAQYVDEIDIAVNDADHLIKNLKATFECIRHAGLKLTMHKCHFGATEIDFLGRTITPEGFKPQKEQRTTFLEKTKIPQIQKSPAEISWFPQLLEELHTKIIRETSPFLSTPQKGRESTCDHRASTTI